MQKKSNAKRVTAKAPEKKKSKLLLTFVCIFVAIVLIFSTVLISISISKSKNSVASYGGTYMSLDTAVYFTTVFKSDYMTMLKRSGVKGVEDSPGFWNSTAENGEKYIDLLCEGAKEYIRQIVVLNYLFDRYSSLTSADEERIEAAVSGTLIANGGTVSAFNEAAGVYGFDYDTYKEAVKLLYKAASCESVVCGVDGANLKASTSSDVISFRNEYLSEYSHVSLLYISTDYTFVLDKDGNRMGDGEGGYQTRELTKEEKAERTSRIESIRSAIAAIGTDDVQMGPDMFENYLYSDLYSGMLETREHGYYFHKSASATASFDSKEVVEKSLEMKIGEFGEVTLEGGVCFIYKMTTSPSDLTVSELEGFFSDFYQNLSDEFIADMVSLATPSVTVRESFDDIDLILLPYNYTFIPSFER